VTTTSKAHLLSGALEILDIEELGGAVTDQLLGTIAEDGQRTRADAQKIAPAIDHQDEIERGFEDALVDGTRDVERLLGSDSGARRPSPQ
jgi:hypothetical protein